jgi:hypothetical protein
MPILTSLFDAYRREGIEICAGLPPPHFKNAAAVNFTWFLKDGRSLTTELGIALQEIYFLENFFAVFKPSNIVIIGNSMGWSTIAISLLLPASKVIAIDSGVGGSLGFPITSSIAEREHLNARVVKGTSPQDVSAIVDAELGGRVDFAFIDGLHTNEQIVLDFKALKAKADERSIYLCHDVHSFNLYDGIATIEQCSGWTARLLRSTPSGMAIICDWQFHAELGDTVAPFAPSAATQALVEREALLFEGPKERLSVIRRLFHFAP